MNAYCLFCKTGAEHEIEKRINVLCSNMEVLVPVRVLSEKIRGAWKTKERLLIPGYVFIFSDNNLCFDHIRTLSGVYKPLEYETGERKLHGSDYEYATWLYKYQGRIENSKALIEGDAIRVVEGPLQDGIGRIVRLNKHNRRAMVEFNFDGRIQKISLSVTELTPV